MSEYVKNQIGTALRTFPWYVGVPGLFAAILCMTLFLIGEHKPYLWNILWSAIGFGAFVWAIRQGLRLLWTVRTITR